MAVKTWKTEKDPGELLDYGYDWTKLLDPEDDTIADSEWVIPDGINSESGTYDDKTVAVWLSGGTHGQDYDLVNNITTEAGRIHSQTLRVKVRDK